MPRWHPGPLLAARLAGQAPVNPGGVTPCCAKEDTMATAQELALRDKKELVSKDEKTVPGRYFVPFADIYETDQALCVVMEMPGVERKDVDVGLENGVL